MTKFHKQSAFLGVILFSIHLIAQNSSDTLLQKKPDNSYEIYRSMFETAYNDNTIDKSEKVMLKTLQKSLNLTDEEVDSIKQGLFSQQLTQLDQSGRWPLVVQNMIYAGTLYGWMIPYVLDVQDVKWYMGSEMMSLGFSYYLTYKYTKNMEISYARAQMIRMGSAVGLVYGKDINKLLGLKINFNNKDSNESKLGSLILMVSVPAGIYFGNKLNQTWKPSHGQSWSLSLWSEIGAYTTRQIHYMISDRPQKPPYPIYPSPPYYGGHWEYNDQTMQWEWVFPNEEREAEYNNAVTEYELELNFYEQKKDKWKKKMKPWKKIHTLFDMVGYPLGMSIYHLFFREKRFSFGDAIMLFQGRWLGWIYGAMISDILHFNWEKSNSRFTRTSSSILGTLLMNHFIKGKDYTFGQSILTILGTGSGMAFTIGLAVIMEVHDSETVEIMTMAGGMAGLYLSNSILQVKSEVNSSSLKNDYTFSMIPSFTLMTNIQGEKKYITVVPTISLHVNF